MNAKPKHNAVVTKANAAIEKMAKFDLPEFQLVAYCLAHYDSRNPDNYRIKASVKDLSSIFSINKKSAYRVVREAMMKVANKPLEYKENKIIKLRHWFTGFDYVEGDGEFEFMINGDLKDLFLGLTENFTRYRLKDVYQFKSATTWKLYENLKRWHKSEHEWQVSLGDLKRLLGLNSRYPKWYEFRRRVILPAVKEINEKSDLTIDFRQLKRVRRVAGIAFFIQSRSPVNVIDVDNAQDALYKSLLENDIHPKTAVDYAQRLDEKSVAFEALAVLPRVVESWKKKESGVSKQAYILGALKNRFFQTQLFDEKEETTPEHKPALECWQEWNKKGLSCKAISSGTGKGRWKRCKQCFGYVQPAMSDQ